VSVPIDIAGLDVSNVVNYWRWRSKWVIRVGGKKIVVVLSQWQIEKGFNHGLGIVDRDGVETIV
jgi:hypothetical protein